MARVNDYHYYHGAALALITEQKEFTSINKLEDFDTRCVYLVNHDRAMYVKHSTNQGNTWQYTFAPEHQKDLKRLFDRYGSKVYIVLVCYDEICVLKTESRR